MLTYVLSTAPVFWTARLLYIGEKDSCMEKIIVAAVSENRVIGKNGDIPWHLPEDLKHFKQLTMGNPVVMGRKTYESLPDSFRPLPGRTNIVLTRSEPEVPESVELANSLDEAWSIAEEYGEEVYVIGGSSIYEQTIEDADRMVLTRVHESFEGDSFFPDWNKENWEELEREDKEKLSFITYRAR